MGILKKPQLVRTRDFAKSQLPQHGPAHTEVNDPDVSGDEDEPHELQGVAQEAQLTMDTPESLYPTFPWKYNQSFQGEKNFTASAPAQWRRYSKGGEWLFGLNTFFPLHWYWNQLEWPAEPNEHSVSWLELALDFHGSTHCQLSMPDNNSGKHTPSSAAQFFERSSKRMGVICGAKLCPASFLEHSTSLTALGFNRTAGLSQRPKLLCPEYVHTNLLQLRQTQPRGPIKLRNVTLTLTPAPPLLYRSQQRMRLTHKQPAPAAYQQPAARRIVKSHKEQAKNIVWSIAEIQQLEGAGDWRARYRLQKILLNNRNAELNHKHVIQQVGTNKISFKCSLCQKTTTNLSRLTEDTCGGLEDRDVSLPGGKRFSVVMNKRLQIVANHNQNRVHQHLLKTPTNTEELPECTLCQRQQTWQGWKRIQRFMRETCSQAN